MKKLLLILLCLPMIGFGQTYVPDDGFEQALINLGYDNVLDDYVTTSNINTVTYLDVGGYNMADLTGIEDFVALTYLDCDNSNITSLDVSNNTNLTYLDCDKNPTMNSLIVSNNTALTHLDCDNNFFLTSLDLSQNTVLTYLSCYNNLLTSLDLSQNTALTYLDCSSNQLTSLDVRNGNNPHLDTFICILNPNLTCINVDDAVWSTANWTGIGYPFWFDSQHFFSTNCPPPTAIEEHNTNELIKMIDILGREKKGKKNEPLFYIYDDGTVEKRIVIE